MLRGAFKLIAFEHCRGFLNNLSVMEALQQSARPNLLSLSSCGRFAQVVGKHMTRVTFSRKPKAFGPCKSKVSACYHENDKFIEEKNAYATLRHHETRRFLEAQHAYRILSDPAKKTEYDSTLKNAVLAQTEDRKHVTKATLKQEAFGAHNRCEVPVVGTLYDVLGVKADASLVEIRYAYKQIARRHHESYKFVEYHNVYETLRHHDAHKFVHWAINCLGTLI